MSQQQVTQQPAARNTSLEVTGIALSLVSMALELGAVAATDTNPWFPVGGTALIMLVVLFAVKPRARVLLFAFWLLVSCATLIWGILTAPVAISGSVITPGGAAVAGLPIEVHDSTGQIRITDTDQSGLFRLEAIPQGGFTIWVAGDLLLRGRTQSVFATWVNLTVPSHSIAYRTPIPAPTITPTPTNTSTPTPSPVPTEPPPPTVPVPAGEFEMGSDRGRADAWYRPAHDVFLDRFYIDVFEVTNGQYAACVRAGECRPPEIPARYAPSDWPQQPVPYADYPVVNISWDDAQQYCMWRGGHLPTEAQWEKAARWDPSTGFVTTYPWGEEMPNQRLANYDSSGPTQVGALPGGASHTGIYDAAGNVLEWVSDWYNPDYYQSSPIRNPLGPDVGYSRVAKGGSWASEAASDLWTFARFFYSPSATQPFIGFRCAYDTR